MWARRATVGSRGSTDRPRVALDRVLA
jgi:hypothetical protein